MGCGLIRVLAVSGMSPTRAPTAGEQAQRPYTLGFASPEMLAEQQPYSVAGEKVDVYAVGVMGLMLMGSERELPFGPSRQQAQELQAACGIDQQDTCLGAARQTVVQRQHDWVSRAVLSPQHTSNLSCSL